jgi:hypothetical protein
MFPASGGMGLVVNCFTNIGNGVAGFITELWGGVAEFLGWEVLQVCYHFEGIAYQW